MPGGEWRGVELGDRAASDVELHTLGEAAGCTCLHTVSLSVERAPVMEGSEGVGTPTV